MKTKKVKWLYIIMCRVEWQDPNEDNGEVLSSTSWTTKIQKGPKGNNDEVHWRIQKSKRVKTTNTELTKVPKKQTHRKQEVRGRGVGPSRTDGVNLRQKTETGLLKYTDKFRTHRWHGGEATTRDRWTQSENHYEKAEGQYENTKQDWPQRTEVKTNKGSNQIATKNRNCQMKTDFQNKTGSDTNNRTATECVYYQHINIT